MWVAPVTNRRVHKPHAHMGEFPQVRVGHRTVSRPNSTRYHLILSIKFDRNVVTSIHMLIVCDCFYPIRAVLFSCNENCGPTKTTISPLWPFIEKVTDPALGKYLGTVSGSYMALPNCSPKWLPDLSSWNSVWDLPSSTPSFPKGLLVCRLWLSVSSLFHMFGSLNIYRLFTYQTPFKGLLCG